MAEFSFGVDTSVGKSNQSKKLDSICIASKKTNNSNKHVLLLLENFPLHKEKFKLFIEAYLSKYLPGFDYDVVSASAIKASLPDIKKKAVYKFYQENGSDFSSYIKENTVIISSGYALQGIIKADDLSVDCFYDYIFNKTYFYAPQVRRYVVPIDSFTILTLFENDRYTPSSCSRSEFAKKQLSIVFSKYGELSKPPMPKRFRVVQVKSREDWLDIVKISKNYTKVSWDIETDGTYLYRNRVGCVSISFDGVTGYYVPMNFFNPKEFDEIIDGKIQIGTNKKFDDKFMKLYGCKKVYTHSDLLHLGHLLNEMRFNGQKSLAYYYSCYGGYDYPLDQYIQKFRPKSYLDIPLLPSYAAQDAIHAYNIHEEMQKQLTELDKKFPPPNPLWKSMRYLYEEIVMPYVNIFTDLEIRGVPVDRNKWEEGCLHLYKEINELKEEIRKQFNLTAKDVNNSEFDSLFEYQDDEDENDGLSAQDKNIMDELRFVFDFDVDSFGKLQSKSKDELQSGKKLGELLELRGWENLGRTKQGWYKTSDDQLLRWSQLGHKEATLLQKMRSLLTLQKSFFGMPGRSDTTGWKAHIIDHADGRSTIHPNYKVMLTDTFRNGCGSPNWQNIPSTSKNLGDNVERFKRVFTVPDLSKYYFLTLDKAAFQIRLATVDSQDPVLMDAFRKNPKADIHSKTAFNIFCSSREYPLEEVIIDTGDKVVTKFAHETVKVKRGDSIVEVEARDLKETDILL